jgi:NAD(P)-dependent dehydrogenase (short-subunit alcohol dehydrogenase family)
MRQNMTRGMAVHHAPQGIRVNCVCPGMVYTPMMYSGGMTDEARAARKNRSLLKTEGTGWDVGAAVRFLAGDEARWMTGIVSPSPKSLMCFRTDRRDIRRYITGRCRSDLRNGK